MTQSTIAAKEIQIDEASLKQAFSASLFPEKRAKDYLENLRGTILNSRITLKNGCLKYRKVSLIAKDAQLREYLPAGLPEELYSQDYHRGETRQLHAELCRLTDHVVHPKAYGNAAGKDNQAAFMVMHQYVLAGSLYVLRCDFEQCFNTVDLDQLYRDDLIPLLGEHPYLRDLLITLQIMPRHLIQTDEWETELDGILQGLSPASRLLDLHLRGYDSFCDSLNPTYIRYCDDSVMGFSTEQEAEGAKAQLDQYIAENYPTLKFHPEKTKIVRWDELQFVGYTYVRGTTTITLADRSASSMKVNFSEFASKLRETTSWDELVALKNVFKQLIHAARKQLSIVQDEAIKAEIWAHIGEAICWDFKRRYKGLQEQRFAFHKLGIKQGVSRNLLRGITQPVPSAPFSTEKLGELLFNSWNLH